MVVAPEGVGRTSSKSMEVGREIPTVGEIEMPELSSVAVVVALELFSVAEAAG